MKIKFLSLSLLASIGLAFGSNEIYLDQIGSAGIFNISQIGSANKLGEVLIAHVLKVKKSYLT